ncbi:MAG: hydrogenase nickel incorporation protein HypB [Synechococcaceae cyanobacterium]|nr:hydrogenase nickel incorporation protein HypB [Synechococcaceae cyanobacterium]
MTTSQRLVGRSLLEHNSQLAQRNRERFARAGVRAVNLLSSPGAGKTALLEHLARQPGAPARMAALVGDLATDLDAARLRAAGLPAVGLNTGQACHLEAAMVARGVERLEREEGLALEDLDWLLIENVGNLVCPAAFDLGESLRLVLLSVPEGEDKPLKYPAMFRSADVVAISKSDLITPLAYDLPAVRRAIERVAPQATVLTVSCRDGHGLEALWPLLQGWNGQS